MFMIQRDDGSQFVIHAYRELLIGKKKTLIAKKVNMLAQQHGKFVHLSQKGHARYEAVFSTKSGFLLGESIKHYFNHAQNLIFCEHLSQQQKYLLVVIRGGSVYLDNIISSENIKTELLSVFSGKEKYQVVTSGNEPLISRSNSTNFSLPNHLLDCFEHLEKPLFPRLPALRSLQLLELPLALKSQQLNSHSFSILSLLTVCILISCAFLFIITHKKKTLPIKSINSLTKITINRYERYNMLSPPAKYVLEKTVTLLRLMYDLPGWQAKSIGFSHNQFTIAVYSLGADLTALHHWARDKKINYELTPKKVILKSPLEFRPSSSFYKSLPLQDLLDNIIDKLDILLYGKHLEINKIKKGRKLSYAKITIDLDDASPQILMLIAETVNKLPISIEYLSLKLQSGNIKGKIQLSLWGKS